MNTKVLLCCHKECQLPKKEPYFPIHVGKALAKIDLGIQGDDSGDNISVKNKTYCELTGMYWAWKNLKNVDIIGLCHYRRFFDFHHQCESFFSNTVFNNDEYDKIDLSIQENDLRKLNNHSIIVASPIHYEVSLYYDYCRCHLSDDFLTLKKVIEGQNELRYIDAFNKVMYQNNKLHNCNMFIMTWKVYNDYCKWLFRILSKVESEIDITNYSPVQKRIFGYMGERLLNVFIEANKLKVYEKKVIWFNDNKIVREPKLKYFIKRIVNSICFKFMRPVYY
jgi:hypothetical protein